VGLLGVSALRLCPNPLRSGKTPEIHFQFVYHIETPALKPGFFIGTFPDISPEIPRF
jgi:hypothetical protein